MLHFAVPTHRRCRPCSFANPAMVSWPWPWREEVAMEGDAAAANALDVQEGFDALSLELSRACMAPFALLSMDHLTRETTFSPLVLAPFPALSPLGCLSELAMVREGGEVSPL